MKKLLLFIALLFIGMPMAHAQATVALSPVARQFFLNEITGLPLSGGKLCTYQAGTTTPQATYVDSTGISQNTNPIILDSEGQANIWLVTGEKYKFVLYDNAGTPNTCTGNLQWTVDNVSVAGGGSVTGCAPTGSQFSVLYIEPLGGCHGVSKFTSNDSGQVDINNSGTLEIDSPLIPANNFTFAQGHQVYVKSTSANWDGTTDDGFTSYVDDSQTPPRPSIVTATNVTVSGGTLTVAAAGANAVFTYPGMYGYFSGFVTATFLNGNIYQITNADATGFTAVNTGLSDYGSAADSGNIQQQASSNPTPNYCSGGVQWGGDLTCFDSETGGENPQSHSMTDYVAGAYGDGPELGYGFRAKEHDLVQVESAQFIADTDDSSGGPRDYTYKAGLPNQTPYWWVWQDGSSFSRQGFFNIASSSIGSCSLSTGQNDCTAILVGTNGGPPTSEVLKITICATGAVYDTFDWTLDGSSPSCQSQHMLPTVSGDNVADGVQMIWGAQTGHTVGATASIPITVTYGSQLGNLGGTYLSSTALPQPATPILTPSPSGSSVWEYCVSQTWNGITTNCSPTATTSVGPSTLDASHTISVAVGNYTYSPAVACTLYRLTAGGVGSTTGIIAGPNSTVCSSIVLDNGIVGDNSSPPATNLTGHTTLNDGYLVTPASNFILPQISGTGCIGITSGVVSATASGCSSGSLSIEVNGGAALTSPVNFQNGTGGNAINFSNPSGSNIQATINNAAVTSAMLANSLTLPGTTTGTFSGPLTGSVTGNVTGNASGTAGTITGSLIKANTPLTTNQDLFYLNGSSLARLPISTVSVGNCLGNNSGTWGDFTCSGGSGSGINININGGSNLGGPANFQNGTSGNNINFSNPSGSIVQAVVQSASITSAMLASGLTLGGTTSGTFSGNLTGTASLATALASYTNYSVYGSGLGAGAWITPTGNSQCLMSDPSSFASVTPSFQVCAITIAGTSVLPGGSTSALPSPGIIGGVTPAAAHFTTGSFTGQLTSTLSTGTAPFSIASTTVVPNLNVSSLLGGTWAIPGTIGSTTANTGAFTTLSASSTVSGSGFSLYLASPPLLAGALRQPELSLVW